MSLKNRLIEWMSLSQAEDFAVRMIKVVSSAQVHPYINFASSLVLYANYSQKV
jgi:hypothetical protein